MRNVQIQTISTCNSRCDYCPWKDSWFKDNPGTMSDELFTDILNKLKPYENELNTGKFCPYLMNEPLTDKKMIDRIKQIYKTFPNVMIELSTNAELLTADKRKSLISIMKDKKHSIWISCPGITEEQINNVMHINGKKVLENTKALIIESNGKLNITVKGFLYSFDSKVKYLHPRKYIRYWRKFFEENDINTKYVNVEASSFHSRSGNVNIDNWESKEIVRHITPNSRFYCARIDNWIHFLYNGDMVLCCNDYFRETVINNIKDLTIEEHLQSKSFKKMKDNVLGNVITDKNFLCNRCTRIGG